MTGRYLSGFLRNCRTRSKNGSGAARVRVERRHSDREAQLLAAPHGVFSTTSSMLAHSA